MKYKIIRSMLSIFSVLLLFILPSSAQDARHISLNDAIDLSIKNSKQLKGNRARIEEAAAAIKEALDRRLPDASASGSYLRLAQPHIKLQTGKDSSGSGSGGVNVSQALYGLVNVSLPIYGGHRIQYGVESAKYLEQAITLDAENDREELILNTMNAYINLYKSKAAVDLVKENLEQSKQRVKDFSNLEKNGLLPRNELLKSQLQSSNIELSLLDAENNRNLATVNMNLMLGLPETTTLVIDSVYVQPGEQLKTIAEYEQLALQNRKLNINCEDAFQLLLKTAAKDYAPAKRTAGFLFSFAGNAEMLKNHHFYQRCVFGKDVAKGSRMLMEAMLQGDTTAASMLDDLNSARHGLIDQ